MVSRYPSSLKFKQFLNVINCIHYLIIAFIRHMGKEGLKDDQNKEKELKQPKKIIKKIPFKLSTREKNKQQDQDLKNWKPIKIAENIEQQKRQLRKQKVNIAANFLMALPKPKNEQSKEIKFSFDEKSLFKSTQKQEKVFKPTDQQIKWDIEDQTFIKKQFDRQNKQKIQHQLIEDDEGQVVVQQIHWLNQQKPKIKQIDLTKAVDRSWHQQKAKKSQFQQQIWDSSLLKGKGQISQFVRDAIKRFDDDEVTINKQHLNKKKMRSRYGW